MMDFIISANILVDYVLILIGVYIVMSSIMLFIRRKNASNTSEIIKESSHPQKSATKTNVFSILLATVLIIVALLDLFSNKASVLGVMSNMVLVVVAIFFVYYVKKRWA